MTWCSHFRLYLTRRLHILWKHGIWLVGYTSNGIWLDGHTLCCGAVNIHYFVRKLLSAIYKCSFIHSCMTRRSHIILWKHGIWLDGYTSYDIWLDGHTLCCIWLEGHTLYFGNTAYNSMVTPPTVYDLMVTFYAVYDSKVTHYTFES